MTDETMLKCPPISQHLIDYLEQQFPDRAVDPREVNPTFKYGQMTVVRHLKLQHELQEEVTYVPT